MDEFRIDMSGAPLGVLRGGPSVGDVYRKDGGPSGVMVIVSDNGSTFGYLAVNPEGQITGVGQGNAYYFSRRAFVGRVTQWPLISIQWET